MLASSFVAICLKGVRLRATVCIFKGFWTQEVYYEVSILKKKRIWSLSLQQHDVIAA